MKLSKIIIVALLFSCTQEKHDTPKEGVEKILGVYIRKDSMKVIDILLRKINKTIKFDSSKSKDIIVVDTIWGYPTYVPLRDSLNKIVLDSFKKQVINPNPIYYIISKDSVNWRIQNIPVDSLIKK